jgi:hypothetical protein
MLSSRYNRAEIYSQRTYNSLQYRQRTSLRNGYFAVDGFFGSSFENEVNLIAIGTTQSGSGTISNAYGTITVYNSDNTKARTQLRYNGLSVMDQNYENMAMILSSGVYLPCLGSSAANKVLVASGSQNQIVALDIDIYELRALSGITGNIEARLDALEARI